MSEKYRVTLAGTTDEEKEVFSNGDGEIALSHYQKLRKLYSRRHVTFRLYRGKILLRTAGTAVSRHARAKARSEL